MQQSIQRVDGFQATTGQLMLNHQIDSVAADKARVVRFESVLAVLDVQQGFHHTWRQSSLSMFLARCHLKYHPRCVVWRRTTIPIDGLPRRRRRVQYYEEEEEHTVSNTIVMWDRCSSCNVSGRYVGVRTGDIER